MFYGRCVTCVQVNKVIELVPTAVSLLDRLRIQADRIRQIGIDLSANITTLRNEVQVARDQANIVSLSGLHTEVVLLPGEYKLKDFCAGCVSEVMLCQLSR